MSGISLFCFTASYTVALAVEALKLLWPAAWLRWVAIGFTVAGLVAQGLYLYQRIWPAADEPAFLANWYQWCLVAAGVVAIAYLIFKFTHPTMAVGLFFLPIVMALIGIAYLFSKDTGSFRTGEARHWWGLFHGISFLAGTVGVLIGFAAGIMYLVQSYRLRAKLPPTEGFELPSLEWLQLASSRSLLASTVFLAIGLVSGVCMNLAREPMLPWTDSVIVSSGVLFLWLLAATIFEFFYRPAREGQKVAYLTIAQFIFLCLALGFALYSHARGGSEEEKKASGGVGTEYRVLSTKYCALSIHYSALHTPYSVLRTPYPNPQSAVRSPQSPLLLALTASREEARR